VPDENSIRRMVRKVVYRTLGLSGDRERRVQRPLVTELDVRDLPVGAELPIPEHALITPLARQIAMERKVRFISKADPAAPAASLAPTSTGTPAVQGGSVVAIGADHGGYALKNDLIALLHAWGYQVTDCGTNSTESVDYPDFALAVAQLVAGGAAWRGVLIDGAGIGSCMAANKVPGVLAAMCYDQATAHNSREHNNANVLTLGAGMIGANVAQQILKTFLETEFAGGRHARRVDKILAIERRYLRP
jgi:ribose 5-phosphate isomerase B